MPTDPFFLAPATAEVSAAAAGNLVALAYRWTHPDDRTQDGLLVIGPTDESDMVVALWGDSWHQSPAPKVISGVIDGGEARLTYVYADDWHWQITVDATEPDALRLRMSNVVPESAATDDMAAGSYLAMDTDLRRLTEKAGAR